MILHVKILSVHLFRMKYNRKYAGIGTQVALISFSLDHHLTACIFFHLSNDSQAELIFSCFPEDC